MLETPFGISIFSKFLQYLNAANSIVFTLSGIVIFFKLSQLSNAFVPIEINPFYNITLSNFSQQ